MKNDSTESVARWGQEIEGNRRSQSVIEGKKRGEPVIKWSIISALASSHNIRGQFALESRDVAILVDPLYFPLVPNMLRSPFRERTGWGQEIEGKRRYGSVTEGKKRGGSVKK